MMKRKSQWLSSMLRLRNYWKSGLKARFVFYNVKSFSEATHKMVIQEPNRWWRWAPEFKLLCHCVWPWKGFGPRLKIISNHVIFNDILGALLSFLWWFFCIVSPLCRLFLRPLYLNVTDIKISGNIKGLCFCFRFTIWLSVDTCGYIVGKRVGMIC